MSSAAMAQQGPCPPGSCTISARPAQLPGWTALLSEDVFEGAFEQSSLVSMKYKSNVTMCVV